jgi:hypothetical protein
MPVVTSRAAASPAMTAATRSQIRLQATVVFTTANGELMKNSSTSASASVASLVIRNENTSRAAKKSHVQGRRIW